MAIQFLCAGCQQPIEVDEEFAGKAAACPYCQRVVTVPAASTYSAATASARPVAPGSGGAFPPVPGHDPRLARAKRLGSFGLVCAGLLAATLVTIFATSFSIAMPLLRANPASQPTQEQLVEALQRSGKLPLVNILVYASILLALVGGALSVASLSSRANWRGAVALLICAPVALCFCAGFLLPLIGAGG